MNLLRRAPRGGAAFMGGEPGEILTRRPVVNRPSNKIIES
jgi:hypothetical protein